jgi:hypothetical protein
MCALVVRCAIYLTLHVTHDRWAGLLHWTGRHEHQGRARERQLGRSPQTARRFKLHSRLHHSREMHALREAAIEASAAATKDTISIYDAHTFNIAWWAAQAAERAAKKNMQAETATPARGRHAMR